MRDGQEEVALTEWARYLRAVTDRPSWSVARLARESGLHRSTIFRWLEGDESRSVTLRSVQRVAMATGDELDVVLRAAGSVLEREDADLEDFDLEIEMIEASNLPGSTKEAMIRQARRLRDRQIAERKALTERHAAEREQVRTWIEIAGGHPAADPA